MRTEMISVQPFDDVHSVIDKMNQILNANVAVKRILIIWPKRGRLIEEPLDFGRLATWAKHHDVQIAIAVRDPFIQKIAAERNIPVFSSRENAQQENWISKKVLDVDLQPVRQQAFAALHADKETVSLRTRVSKWSYLLLLPVFAVVFIVLSLLIPHAIIYVPRENAVQTLSIPFWTSEELETATKNGGIPSKVDHLFLNLQATVPATDRVHSKGMLASGTITLSSSCVNEQRISAGTLVMTADSEPKKFHLLEEIQLASGETKDAGIIADSSGSDSNLSEGSIVLIDKPFDSCIQVLQSRPTSGGTDGIYPSPGKLDYDHAASLILEQVESEANQAIQDLYGSLRMPLKNSLRIEKVSDEILTPEIGYAGSELTLQQTIEVSVRTVSYQDMIAFAKLMMDHQKNGVFFPKNDAISFQDENPPVLSENGLITWSLIAERVGSFRYDADQIRAIVTGKKITYGKAELEAFFQNSDAFSVQVWPAWIRSFPVVSANIWIWDQ
jgi:hypothetical protein